MKAILRPVILSLIVCSTTWVPMAMAEEPGVTSLSSVDASGSGHAVMTETSGYAVAPPFGPTYNLQGVFGDGLGWDDYYQGSIFMPWHINPGTSLMYGVVKGAGTQNSQGVVNVGWGYRNYVRNWDRIFGVSGWYDFDGGYRDDYHRAGVSFESLGKYLDFRANGYFLLNSDPKEVSNHFIGDPFFRDNYIIALRQIITEFPYDGADFEVGGPLPFLGKYGIYGHTGAYYLHSNDDIDAVGWKTRLDVAVTDDISVGVNFTNDQVFGSNTNVNVAWQFPDGRARRWFKPRPVRERLNMPVVRNDRISVRTERDVNGEPLLNPLDGEPIFVVHVDPNSAGIGNGTFENPYRLMESARAANAASIDIFRILPRTDNSGTNLVMSGPFNLFDNQRVLGATVPHTVTAIQGVFAFPGQVSGSLPIVSNGVIAPGTSVFNLADNNEISGINIFARNAADTASGNGIGNLAPIIDFNLNRNEFSDYVNAVALVNATGDGFFAENVMTGTPGLSNDGLQIANTLGTLDLLVDGNQSSGNDNAGYNVNAGGASTINSTVTDNEATGNGTGFLLASSNGTHNIEFDNNQASLNTGVDTQGAGGVTTADAGVVILSDGGTTNVTSFTGNELTNNSGHNAAFIASGALGASSVNVDNFTGNTITGSGTSNTTANPASGVFAYSEGATSTVTINIGEDGGTPNTITGNGVGTGGGHGIQIATLDQGTVRGSIVNNNISNNSGFGISVHARSGLVDFGTLPNRLISNNLIDGNVDAGIGIRLSDDGVNASTGRFIIDGNQITNTTDGANALFDGDGIHVRTEDTSVLALLTIENNLIGIDTDGNAAGNDDDGVEIEMYQNSQAPAITIQSNFAQFNGESGVHFFRNGDAFLDNVVIDDNVLSDNTLNGLFLDMQGGDIDIVTPGPLVINYQITKNTIQRNATGVTINSTADADVSIQLGSLLNGNTITDNSGDGILAQTDFFAQIRGAIEYNMISDNGTIIGDHGIQLVDLNNGDTSFDIDINRNDIERNFDDGINYTAAGAGNATIDIDQNNILDNGGDGVDASLTLLSTADIDLDNNTIAGNGQSGVEMLVDDFAILGTISVQNTIQNNGDDGWSLTTDTGNAAVITATLTDNKVRFNAARGYDIYNQWNGYINVDIIGTNDPTVTTPTSLIDSNGLQGVMVQNEADPSRSLTAGLFTTNSIDFRLNQTEVRGNGVNAVSDDDGNGVYIRVGTATAAPFGYVGPVGRVQAALESNHFSGNLNIDVVTESFTATVDPPVVNPFTDPYNGTTSGFVPDPLARLNFRLVGNVGQQIDVTRIGAFYNNSDPYKTIPGIGPFGAGDLTRRRNAQANESDITAAGSPTTVAGAPAPAPTTTVFSSTNAVIGADGDLVNALVQFTGGANSGQTQQISSTTLLNQAITVGAAFGAAPGVGDPFTITATNQAGTGASTFVTEFGNVTAGGNTWDTIVGDFGDTATFANASGAEAAFPYTWTTGAVFPASPWP